LNFNNFLHKIEEELGLELFDYEFDKELFKELIQSNEDGLEKLSILMNIYSDDKVKNE